MPLSGGVRSADCEAVATERGMLVLDSQVTCAARPACYTVTCSDCWSSGPPECSRSSSPRRR